MRGFGAFPPACASFFALVLGSLLLPSVAWSSALHTPPSEKLPFTYNTSGVVDVGADPASVTGPAVLQFQGVTGALFNPNQRLSSPLSLGQFVVAPSSPGTGQTTTYSDTPFEVEIQTPEFNKSNSVPVLSSIFPTFGKSLGLKTTIENSLLLKGHLDGTVGPNGQTNMIATVDSIKLGSMDVQTQDHVTHYAFPIRFSQLKLPPSWVLSPSATNLTIPRSSPSTTGTAAPTPAAEMFTSPATTGSIAPPPAAEMMTGITSTPEPSTILLFGTVLGGLLLGRRRLSAR